MHADIAAYSSGVPVIPFSYSRKFEGLFGTLQYPYTIRGKELSTEQAINKTIDFIKKYEILRSDMNVGMSIANAKIEEFKAFLNTIIK